MGRRISSVELLKEAKAGLTKAKTIEELRQVQAVVLPLEFGLSLDQTAQEIGVSVGWACQLRTRFVRAGGFSQGTHATRGGRLREKSFSNHVFDSLDALENHLEVALRDMELDPRCAHSIIAWPWIINSLTN